MTEAKVDLGQDATGKWAFMIKNEAGAVIASDDDFDTAEQALTFATHKLRKLSGKDTGQ